MIFLFKNELLEATITSLYANTNYPVTNIQSDFLYKKFKATTYGDTIHMVLPRNTSIDCFFYAYSNATSMTVRLYDNTSTLLDTITVDCTGSTKPLKSGSAHFTAQTVRIIEVDATCPVTEDLFIGGLAAGTGIYNILPLISFDKDFDDPSSKDASDYGQVSYQYVPALLNYSLSFNSIPRSTYHTFADSFHAIGSGFIWIDITEDNHAVYQPMYCTTNFIAGVDRNDYYTVSFSIKFTEAR